MTQECNLLKKYLCLLWYTVESHPEKKKITFKHAVQTKKFKRMIEDCQSHKQLNSGHEHN